MKNEIFDQFVSIVKAENQPFFATEPSYQNQLEKRAATIETWKQFNDEEKIIYKNKIEKYQEAQGLLDPKDPSLIPAKNLHLMNQEVLARLNTSNILEQLPIDSFYFEKSTMELLENIENLNQIKDLYKIRKRTVKRDDKSGLNTAEAIRLRNCLRQGRDLYWAGKHGSLMVKPLNFFYSLTAYSYAAIILNNPVRHSLENLPGSHGLNFLPTEVRSQFGGDGPRGTFTELASSFPTLLTKSHRYEVVQDNQEGVMALYRNRVTVGTGTLLSMIPEIRDYYRLITKSNGRTHQLEISQSNDRFIQKWEFHIGDGEIKPSMEQVQQAFPNYQVNEKQGKYIVEVPVSELQNIRACIFSDARSRLWFIENPFYPILLPEICVHFLLSNTFSNIMRYSPDNWGGILLNEVDSDVSLITRKYLSAFENKIPILVLRTLSKYYPFIE